MINRGDLIQGSSCESMIDCRCSFVNLTTPVEAFHVPIVTSSTPKIVSSSAALAEPTDSSTGLPSMKMVDVVGKLDILLTRSRCPQCLRDGDGRHQRPGR